MRKHERFLTHGIYIFIIAWLIIFNLLLNNYSSECLGVIVSCISALNNCQQGEFNGINPNSNLSVRVTVTCYNSTIEQTDDTPDITAFNDRVKPGTLAVSRDLLELGFVPHSKVYLEGFGVFRVADVMNKRYKKRVDIWIPENDDIFKAENVLLVRFHNYTINNKSL